MTLRAATGSNVPGRFGARAIFGASNAFFNPTANTTSGVAPLTVFFNSLNMPDATTFNTLKTTKFAWNFGDPGSGTWAPKDATATATPMPVVGASRNTRYAPSAGHMYETPGTYTVTLTITPPFGVAFVKTLTITVLDPNTAYPTTQTVCITNGTDFTGAPSGCTQIASETNINGTALTTYLAANTTGNFRILYKCGDTFSQASTANIIPLQARANVRIGYWSTGAQPILKNTTTTVSFSSIISSGFSAASNATTTGLDVAVNGLNLQGDPANTTGRGCQNFDSATLAYDGVSGAILETKGRFVVANCTLTNLATPLYLCASGSAAVNNSITCGIGAGGTVGIAIGFNYGCSNVFIAGNYVDRSNNGEHGIRANGIFQGDIYSNYVKKAAVTKHLLTVREFQLPTEGAVPTQYVFSSNNYLDGAGSTNLSSYCQWAQTNVSVGGQIQYIIDDHNYDAHWDWASAPANYSMTNRIVCAQYIIFRHNVHEMSCPSNGGIAAMFNYALQNGQAGSSPVTLPTGNVVIDKITCYTGTDLHATCVLYNTQVHDVSVTNYLRYGPLVTKDGNSANINTMALISGTGGTNCVPPDNVAANLLASFDTTGTQSKNTDPQWVTAVPIVPTDFILKTGTGSYALTGSSSGGSMGANLQDLTAI